MIHVSFNLTVSQARELSAMLDRAAKGVWDSPSAPEEHAECVRQGITFDYDGNTVTLLCHPAADVAEELDLRP